MKNLEIHPEAKALIFDVDGTLADSMPVIYISWRNALKSYGIDFTPEIFLHRAGLPLKQTVEELNEQFGTSMNPIEVRSIVEKDFQEHMHLVKPVEPVCKLVREFKGKIPMALGTGGQRENAWKIIETIGLRDCFEVLVAADDVENFKPAPDTFLKGAELLGVDPKHCQVFEDGARGLEAARNAGMIPTDVTKYYQVTIGEELY